MTIYCRKCFKKLDINQHDEYIIRSISAPGTYRIKTDNFLCKHCFHEEHQNNESVIRISRENLGLDIDKDLLR